ncbi:MAG TPA: hypothetical protein VJV79_16700 [Polyangiaceae bacterium]|nr:hypothetical protein [Polyangiaceae bacterium]
MKNVLKSICWIPIAVVMSGCGASPGGGTDDGTSSPTPSSAATDETAPGGVAAQANAKVAEQAGNHLADPAYVDMIELGTTAGWTMYFDKVTNEVVANDGTKSIAFNPNDLENEATMQSLIDAGLPQELLWSWKGVLCRAACWGAAAAGCAAVASVCAVGTVFTVGGFAIPCTVAVIAACGASGAGASVCSDWCTRKYG